MEGCGGGGRADSPRGALGEWGVYASQESQPTPTAQLTMAALRAAALQACLSLQLGAAFVLAPTRAPGLSLLGAASTSCPPPASLSRSHPRLTFAVTLEKPMGLVLEELPGRVFVSELADGGSAAGAAGAVLPGDRVDAVEGFPCEGLDQVMQAIASVPGRVTIHLSRDARVQPVNFEGGKPVAAIAGEPLRDIAGAFLPIRPLDGLSCIRVLRVCVRDDEARTCTCAHARNLNVALCRVRGSKSVVRAARASHRVDFDCQSGRCFSTPPFPPLFRDGSSALPNGDERERGLVETDFLLRSVKRHACL